METLTPGDGSPLLSLPFDHYQRYHLTQRIVSLLWPRRKDHPLRVLDVGGSSSSLKHFLRADDVVLADIQGPPPFTHRERVPFAYDAYFLAAGGHLPFADESFDLVTAHDTLEHVPNDLRPGFLLDLSRVARRFLVLNGPEFDPDAARAEQRLALLLERTELGENVSLEEHLDLGLPDKELVKSLLREQGLAFVDIPNGNLALWLSMMGAKHYIMSFPHSDWLHEVIDRIYNAVVSPEDFGGLCYRRAYVIAKRPGDASVLRRVENAFAGDLSKPAPKWDVRAVEMVLDAMEDHSRLVRGDLVELRSLLAQRDAALQHKDSLLTEKDALLAEKDAALAKTEADLAERESLLAHRDESLGQVTEQLAAIRQSLGYRILEGYRRRIRWLMPPGSRRALPHGALRRAVRWLMDRWPRRSP